MLFEICVASSAFIKAIVATPYWACRSSAVPHGWNSGEAVTEYSAACGFQSILPWHVCSADSIVKSHMGCIVCTNGIVSFAPMVGLLCNVSNHHRCFLVVLGCRLTTNVCDAGIYSMLAVHSIVFFGIDR